MVRAHAMMVVPMRDNPPLAYKYAHYLCTEVGGSLEVYLTAWAHYAQAIEGLACDANPEGCERWYVLDDRGREWFEKNKAEETGIEWEQRH